MTIGLPGCGKSTYAIKKQNEGYHIFSSDAIRREYSKTTCGDSVNDGISDEKVFQILHKDIKNDLRKGYDCIYDATNLSRKKRMAFLQEIKKIDCEKCAVVFIVPVEICKERNKCRPEGQIVPDHVYDRMLRSYNVPYYYEGFDQIIPVYNIGEFENIVYDYIDLDFFSQNSKYHSLSLGMHMKKTAEYIEDHLYLDLLSDSLLWEAARYHDIGKIYTKDFHNMRGEATEYAHYYGHENYGAYIYLCKWAGECERNYPFSCALYVANLINWHMAWHTVWKESERRKENDALMLKEVYFPNVQYSMYDMICKLYEADREAH